MKTLLFALLIALAAAPVCAQKCPRGLVNDPAPGSCGLYVDKNNDNICDRSQKITVSPELKSGAASLSAKQVMTISGVTADEEQPPRRERFPRNDNYRWLWGIVVFTALSELFSVLQPALCLPLRLFWNWALSLSFLLCALSGLVFIFPGWLDLLPAYDYGRLHALSGLIFILLGLYHLLKRLRHLFPSRRSACK